MFRRIFLVLAVLGAAVFAGSASSAEAGHGCYRGGYYGGQSSYYRGSPSYYYGGHHGLSGISFSFGF